MRKNEVLELVKNALGLESKKDAEGFLKEVDALIVALENGLEVGDKAKIGSRLSIEKKHIPARSGKAMGVEWTSEPKDVLKAKIK